MVFEWDEAKAAANIVNHDVSFEEATTVFGDPLAALFEDTTHSDNEIRYVMVGYSFRGRVLFVSHTERDDKTRLISARLANKAEREKHERETNFG